MFIVYYLNSLFTLLNLVFVLVMTEDAGTNGTTVATTITTVKIETKTEEYVQNKLFDSLSAVGPDLYCKFQPNVYKCGKKYTSRKFYYDVEKNECLPFEYGNCKPYNMFSSSKSCKRECLDKSLYPTNTNVGLIVTCRLQPEFGTCNSYFPRWYFDITLMACRGFSYSGCGGNSNRFESSTHCLDTCSHIVKHVDTNIKK